MNPSLNLELKDGDDADPTLVTKALGELRSSIDGRLKDIETKAAANDNSKIVDRLDKLEAKANRPGVG